MSTSSTPGQPSQPASGWFPSLRGSNLPQAAVNGIQQGFSLVYSLRDTVNQLQVTVKNMVQYGKASERSQVNPQAVPDGALFLETDTRAVYHARLKTNSTTRDWVLVINGVAAP